MPAVNLAGLQQRMVEIQCPFKIEGQGGWLAYYSNGLCADSLQWTTI